jgi:hypothetical protein
MMLQDSSNQPQSGCLKPALVHLFVFVLAGWIGHLLMGGKMGTLIGLGAYLSFLSGKLFLRIFGNV